MKWSHYSQIFHHNVKKYNNKIAFRYKENGEWKETTWLSFGKQAMALSKALINSGIREGETVGIFSQNRPEWSIVDTASLMIRGTPTPIDAAVTARQAEYIVNDGNIKLLFVGNQEHYDKVLSLLDNNKYLQKIIVFNRKVKIKKRPEVLFFSDFLDAGRRLETDDKVRDRSTRFSEKDLATLIYTAGATGKPKGVMLTHRNILFQMEIHDQRLIKFDENDISLCFLPLSHVFERMWTYYVFYRGMVNCYLENPRKIIHCIGEIKPTVMCAVPRFYEKFHEEVYQRLGPEPRHKKKLFHWALKKGLMHHLKQKERKHFKGLNLLKAHYKLADTLVLKKIRKQTGGKIRFLACSGAPLSPGIERFFFSIGLPITQGYGLTETTATVTCPEPYTFKFGSVGKPLPGVEVKIDPDTSEILVRGKNVMKGYYKKSRITAEVFTEDGFFRTGDAGKFDREGYLYITDRLKDLIKTSGGKYIAPQRIETIIGADHFITQIIAIGEGRKFVSALIVPDHNALEEFAGNNNIEFSSHEGLISVPEIVKLYKQRIAEASKNLADYEKIKKFKLMPKKFTIEAGEITQTLNIRRKVINEKYKDTIDAIYSP